MIKKSLYYVNGMINYESKDLSNNFYRNSISDSGINILFALPFLIDAGDNHLVRDTIMSECKKRRYGITIVDTLDISPDFLGFGNGLTKYRNISRDIHHLYRSSSITDREILRYIEHIVCTRRIKCLFIVGSELFYQNIALLKKHFPQIKIIDLQFNAIGHLKNNRLNSKYIDITITDNSTLFDIFDLKYNEKKLKCIPTGIDVNRFKRGPKNRNLLLKRIGAPHNKNCMVISYIGRLSPEKKPGLFVEIAKYLQCNESLIFLIAGDGPMRDEIEIKISDLGNTYMLGFVNSMEVYQSSDLLLITSEIEGRPLVVLEAQSMGIPVISTNVGDVPNIIQNEYNGYICKPSVDSFAKAITQLFNDREALIKMSKNSREYAVSHLNIDNTKKAYIDTINQICKR